MNFRTQTIEGELHSVYRMPEGDWGASAVGFMSDGFDTVENAYAWIIKKLEQHIHEPANTEGKEVG